MEVVEGNAREGEIGLRGFGTGTRVVLVDTQDCGEDSFERRELVDSRTGNVLGKPFVSSICFDEWQTRVNIHSHHVVAHHPQRQCESLDLESILSPTNGCWRLHSKFYTLPKIIRDDESSSRVSSNSVARMDCSPPNASVCSSHWKKRTVRERQRRGGWAAIFWEILRFRPHGVAMFPIRGRRRDGVRYSPVGIMDSLACSYKRKGGTRGRVTLENFVVIAMSVDLRRFMKDLRTDHETDSSRMCLREYASCNKLY